MEFGTILNRKFDSSHGAYSMVTPREHVDSQITLTDYETTMVESHFESDNIHVGNVRSDPVRASKQFRLFPNGNIINLNLVYPKLDKSELRLYLSSNAGFKPAGGEVWFMFLQNGNIWIGSMPERAWRRYLSSELEEEEHFDEMYQNSVNDTNTDAIRIATIRQHDIYPRDRNIARTRMEISTYQCEFNPTHQLFVSRFSQRPYLEAHHLIPMGWQNRLNTPLDTIDNVFCLCPTCHRAVHHAEENCARNIICTLAARRPVLNNFGLTIPDLYNIYAVEDIVVDVR